MRDLVKAGLRSVFLHYGGDFMNAEALKDLKAFRSDVAEVLALPTPVLIRLLELRHHSKSQLGQDLFALQQLNFKRDGYFVEFGATNGVDLSNTHLLEKLFGWRGVLAEPARKWQDALRKNRNCCIDERCVWKESGKTLKFTEMGELSTITEFIDSDTRGDIRRRGQTYDVDTISLVDLLESHDAPREIDYLSIDTEGSELEILQQFDFSRYSVRVITCEHNFTPTRNKIFTLLTSKGYRRQFRGLSQGDDWYVLT